MIKRKAHVFHTQLALQEHLDKMGDDETLAQYTVSDGMHYIITETEVEEHENEVQKLEQLIKSTQDHFTEDLDNCIDNMNFYYSQGNMNDYREYVKQYDGIMKRYGERLKDLHKRLDKLKNV
ncbi:hypothetical protein [Enterococcus phage Q69]|nr:hypothetical protein [Enterococcus phage Q69]